MPGRSASLWAPLVLAAALALPAAAPAAPPEEVRGPAEAVDGETLIVAGRRIRLYGIDAPALDAMCPPVGEDRVPCGKVAKWALMDLVTSVEVVCRPRGEDDWGRLIAVCTADGWDVGRNMVHTGWARADRRGPYLAKEAEARAAGRGLWQERLQLR